MMEPARRIRMVGEAEYREQAEASLAAPGDASLVVRARPRSIVMACPDGCGQTLVLNLDGRSGKAWRLDMRGGGLTLYPSVWLESGCESHFIVWRGHVLWCDRFERGNREPLYDADIESTVLEALDVIEPRSATEIADTIDELVWDVDRAARRLVKDGLARTWKAHGEWLFARVPCSPAKMSGSGEVE